MCIVNGRRKYTKPSDPSVLFISLGHTKNLKTEKVSQLTFCSNNQYCIQGKKKDF